MLNEKQIYRIDHYLGKETVQNILVFRFANGIFEPVWNRRISITCRSPWRKPSESRNAAAITSTGTLRDMVQNHLLQLVTLTAWNRRFRSMPRVRDDKPRFSTPSSRMTPEEVLTRTRARPIRRRNGRQASKVPAYRAEENVSPHSADRDLRRDEAADR